MKRAYTSFRRGVFAAVDRLDVLRRSIAGIPLAFCGFAFQKAFISIQNIPASSVFVDNPPSSYGLIYGFSAVLVAVLALKVDAKRLRKLMLPSAVLLQIASIAVLCVAYLRPATWPIGLMLATSLIRACGVVFFSALWVDLYATLNPVRVAFLNAVSILLAEMLIYLVEMNPLNRIFVVAFALPLATGISYHLAANDSKNGIEEERPRAFPASAVFPFPIKVMAFIGACSFAYGVVSISTNAVLARHAAVIPALVVLVFVIINTKRFSISLLYRLAFPLMVCGFLLIALVPGAAQPLPSTMLYAGFASVEMLLLLMVCAISYSTEASALWLFGLLTAVQFFSRQAGDWLERAVGGGIVLVVIAVALVIITSLPIMTEKSLFTIWRAHASNDGDEDFIKVRLSSLASACALTDREVEVLYLLVQGRTNDDIAQNMFISTGTVKTHVYHIYQKLGVHTRKELMALIRGRT